MKHFCWSHAERPNPFRRFRLDPALITEGIEDVGPQPRLKVDTVNWFSAVCMKRRRVSREISDKDCT